MKQPSPFSKKHLRSLKRSVKVIFSNHKWFNQQEVESNLYKLMYVAFSLTSQQHKVRSISFILDGDAYLKRLNAVYRSEERATNVLSFLYQDHPLIGEIFFSYDRIEQELSIEPHKSMVDYTLHLALHSFLHLLGYSHSEENKADDMEKAESEILRQFSLFHSSGQAKGQNET